VNTAGTAFVTGAAVRVGRAISTALADAGFDLVLHANKSQQALHELADELAGTGRRVWVHTADLSDAGETDALGREVAAEHGVLDVVVHNAGIFELSPFATTTWQQYRRMLAVNLDAPFFLTRHLLPNLAAARSPSVIMIGDVAADRVVPGYPHYTVSKAGLHALTRALAVELAPGIRVNAVAPGTVAFPADFGPRERERILARIPLAAEGRVADVAEAVLFLATGPAYVTGHVLAVDGGRSALL